DVVGVDDFALQQRRGHASDNLLIAGENLLRRAVSCPDQSPDFFVDLDRSGFAVVAMLVDLAAQEDLLFLLAESKRTQFAHAELANHLARQLGRAFDVVSRPSA